MATKEIIACVIIGIGVLIILLSTMGLFRYKYVLTRMHIAAQSDTMGLLLIVIGAAIIMGMSFATLKLLTIIVFYWITAPVSSHIVANMELGSMEVDDRDKFKVEKRETSDDK